MKCTDDLKHCLTFTLANCGSRFGLGVVNSGWSNTWSCSQLCSSSLPKWTCRHASCIFLRWVLSSCLPIPKVFHFSLNCNNNMSWKMLLKGLIHYYITKVTSAPTNIKSFYSLTVLASPSAGIPSEKELVSTYCKLRGFSKTSFPNWNFYLALSFFRMASIAQV